MATEEATTSAQAGRIAERMVDLPDGRRIGVAQYGEASGLPVVFFHGSPDSRLSATLLAGAASKCGVRLLALDRPGMGLSDSAPRRRMLDWAADVACVLDQLGLAEVGLVGVSAGAAYVYACCARLPERIAAASIVSGVAPPNMLTGFKPSVVRVMLRIPGLGDAMFNSVAAGARRDPDHYLVPGLVAADIRALSDPAIRDGWITGLLEAYRPGPAGVVRDQWLQLQDWGFKLGDIVTPIRLWHGEADGVVPISAARRVAASLPNASLTVVAGEGHLSTLVQEAEPILADLCARSGRG